MELTFRVVILSLTKGFVNHYVVRITIVMEFYFGCKNTYEKPTSRSKINITDIYCPSTLWKTLMLGSVADAKIHRHDMTDVQIEFII